VSIFRRIPQGQDLVVVYILQYTATMARGNWQRRVELNESRRNEAKQKKQKNEERKVHKTQVQGLITFLDQHSGALWSSSVAVAGTRYKMIHIWTETVPADSPPVLDLWEEETARHLVNSTKRGERGRGRSMSIESENSSTGKTPKKKPHPRSKEVVGTVDAEEETVNYIPKLCRSYFFFGKGESTSSKKGGGKKGQNVHYQKQYRTLADVLLLNSRTNNKNENGESSVGREAAALCEASYIEAHSSGAESSPLLDEMDMLYYISLDLDEFFGQAKGTMSTEGEEINPSLGDWVLEAMASRVCNAGSIVYFTIDDQLLYDRYRDGIILGTNAVFSCATNQSGVSVDLDKSSSDQGQAVMLPASLLEYVLTFLEDPAVASMSKVCSSWNKEIGKQSSNLWSFLLNRRAWPFPKLMEGDDVDDKIPILRDTFLSHYVAVRDTREIKAGINRLLPSTSSGRNKLTTTDREGCVRSFDSLRGAPQEHNTCVGLKVWSPNRVLAAYHHDCSLRLFDSVERNGSCGGRLCREIVCLRIDPYKTTRKRTCQLVGLALDDECIGCLLHVIEDSSEREAHLLAVLSREDFLIDDSTTGDSSTEIIDIGQSVMNFLVSCDEVDHGLLQLHDFLSDHGDVDEVEVLVSQSVTSCGLGRFMVEVSVSIPLGDDPDEDDSNTNLTLLFRKLFIFSANVGAIVWMGDSNPTSVPLRPRREDLTLTSFKTSINGRCCCKIAALSSFEPGIIVGSIDHTGAVTNPTLLPGSDLARSDILQGTWELRQFRYRPVVMLGNEIFAVDNLIQENENGAKSYKSVLSCYPTSEGTTSTLYESFHLQGNLEVCSLTPLRDNHILALCRVFESNAGTADLDEVDGQWFVANMSDANVSCSAILIDIASRSEIYRFCLVDDLVAHLGLNSATNGELPIQTAAHDDTVAAAVWWKGVALSGHDIRQDHLLGLIDHEDHAMKSAKKKKAKPQKKSGKKDGFARGMSLRG
jgi:hypothetical protein